MEHCTRMSRLEGGFSLIELMIVVVIIGLLSATAIPQYQEYVARTQVTDTLGGIRRVQLAVGEYVARYSILPPTPEALKEYTGISLVASDYALGSVASVTIGDNGLLTVQLADSADLSKPIRAKTYMLEASTLSAGLTSYVAIVGGGDPMEAKYLPKMQ